MGLPPFPENQVFHYLPRMKKPRERTKNARTSIGRELPTDAVNVNVNAAIDNRPPEVTSPDYRDMVTLGLEQSRRGEIASDEDVRAVFASFRR